MIKSLSSLRFIFAILVFFVHIDQLHVAIGHAFFIVLSGFILTYVYEERILNGKVKFKEFFKKRLLRIYPLHILTLLVAIPLSLDGFFEDTLSWFGKFFLNLFFLQTFVPNNYVYFSFNGVAWNAADLVIFYSLFIFLIYLFSKLNIKLFTVLILFIILFICISMAVVSEKYYHYVFYISPFFRIFDFIFGMYLYKLTQKISFRKNYTTASILEILVLVFLAVWFGYANYNVEMLKPYLYSVYLWVPLSLVIVVFYYQAGVISKKILSSKIMLSLGGISYSFYMIHQLVIRYSEPLKEVVPHVVYYYIFCFVVSVVLAYVSFNYFENIFYKKKR